MIWIILTVTLYILTCAIALFLICSSDKESGSDAYYDIRNIGVALIWPVVLGCLGIWKLGNKLFAQQKNEENADNKD